MNSLIYDSPFGLLRIITNENKLVSVKLVDAKNENDVLSSHDVVALETVNQLQQYFNKKRTEFDLPISYGNASPFQVAVWESLQRIPYGETISYSELGIITISASSVRFVSSVA